MARCWVCERYGPPADGRACPNCGERVELPRLFPRTVPTDEVHVDVDEEEYSRES